MILIADAGGTKTDWRFVSSSGVESINTAGFNPAISSRPDYFNQLKAKFDSLRMDVSKLHYYGAGVADENLAERVKNELNSVFENAAIEVHSDILGSAKALYGGWNGMIGVLGTGSALAEYDGHSIVYRVPSLGYALGDEGSGFYIAKQWLKRILRDQLPREMKQSFLHKYPDFDEKDVLSKTYKGQNPSREIANYCEFLSDHQSTPYVYNLVYQSFMDYFRAFHLRDEYERNLRWRFAGSIAFYFEEILKKAGSEFDLYIDKIIQSPIEELINYHQQNG